MSMTETGLTLAVSVVSSQRMGIKVSQKSKEAFASDLKAWRDRAGLSQSQASAKLGVNINTLQNWEIARTKPNSFVERMLRQKFKPRR